MAKVSIADIPVNGMFLHRRQVWMSDGKVYPHSQTVMARRLRVNNNKGIERVVDYANFTESLKVEPYDGEVPTGRYIR